MFRLCLLYVTLKRLIPAYQCCDLHYCQIILLHMDLSHHNIQRITKWIQSEVDYNFLNIGYTIVCQDDQVLLEQNDKELKQVCPYCLSVPRYPLFYKCGHLTCLPCLREYRRHIVMFEKLFPCPICKQSCHLNEIYKYQVEKNKRPNSIFNENVQKGKVYLLVHRMWSVLSIGKNPPS